MKKLFFMAIAMLIPSMADSLEGWEKDLESDSTTFVDIQVPSPHPHYGRGAERTRDRWLKTRTEYHNKLSAQNIPDAVYVSNPVDPTKTIFFFISDLASQFKHYDASGADAAIQLMRNISNLFHLTYALKLLNRKSYPKMYERARHEPNPYELDVMPMEELEELVKRGKNVTRDQIGTLLIDALNSPVNEKGLKAVSQYLKNPRFVEQMIEALKKFMPMYQ